LGKWDGLPSLLTAKEVSLIVPTYEEARNVCELVERIEKSLDKFNFEIIIVDDASPDGTAEVAEKLREIYRNIKILRRPRKMGLASAVLDGVRFAESDIIAVMDADLQHPPELLPRMLEKIYEGHDIVVASRYVEGGNIEGLSLPRKLVSKGAVKLAHLLLPKTRAVEDPVSGFFLSRKHVIKGASILNSSGFKILVEVLASGKYNSVVEIPYTFKSRKKGESKLSLREIFNYILLLLKLRLSELPVRR
jgi:dolichol-phosphate mannosyltransferase